MGFSFDFIVVPYCPKSIDFNKGKPEPDVDRLVNED
jgi:hypothetical protein